MRNNIFISNFKKFVLPKLPRGFLILVLLTLATEVFIYTNRAELVKDYWNKFILNEQALINTPGNFDYLIMGDSIQKTGINPMLISKDILVPTLPGGKPMSMYLLLKKYLKKHTPPKIIFLYIDPEEPHESLHVILRYFATIPDYLSIFKDLSWSERGVFLMRYWASIDLRFTKLTERVRYPDSNKVLVREMLANNGFLPAPYSANVIPDDYFLTHTERIQHRITITKRDLKYLDEFMKLTRKKKIKVVFLGMVVPVELYRIYKITGFYNDYLKFYGLLKKKYPQSYFVKDPIMYLDNKYFGDASHMNREGVLLYTTYFKNEVFLPSIRLLEQKRNRRPSEAM